MYILNYNNNHVQKEQICSKWQAFCFFQKDNKYKLNYHIHAAIHSQSHCVSSKSLLCKRDFYNRIMFQNYQNSLFMSYM